jgi:uncharacterized protein (TIRG00374 family)
VAEESRGIPPSVKKTLQILQFFVVGIIIVYVINRNGGARMLATMAQAKPVWLLCSGLCFFGSIAAGALQWHLLLKLQGLSYPFRSCFKIYYLGMFANALIFNIAGDAFRLYKLKKSEADMTAGFIAIFTDRFNGLFVLSLFSLLAVASIQFQGILSQNVTRAIFLSSLSVFLVFLTVALVMMSSRLSRVFQLLMRFTRLTRVKNAHEKIQDSLTLYRSHRLGMLLVLLISCLIHTLRVMGHYFCAPALDISIAPVYFFSFIPIISLTTLIPLNVGGWGLPQGIGSMLYALPGVITAVAGVSLPDANAVRIASGSLTFLPSIIFYVIMLMGGFFISSNMIKKAVHTD